MRSTAALPRLEALDEMELPERPVAVEVRAREFRDQGLEFRLARRRRQRARARVAVEVEVGVRFPVCAERVLARAAAEPREGEETLLERAAEAPEIDAANRTRRPRRSTSGWSGDPSAATRHRPRTCVPFRGSSDYSKAHGVLRHRRDRVHRPLPRRAPARARGPRVRAGAPQSMAKFEALREFWGARAGRACRSPATSRSRISASPRRTCGG